MQRVERFPCIACAVIYKTHYTRCLTEDQHYKVNILPQPPAAPPINLYNWLILTRTFLLSIYGVRHIYLGQLLIRASFALYYTTFKCLYYLLPVTDVLHNNKCFNPVIRLGTLPTFFNLQWSQSNSVIYSLMKLMQIYDQTTGEKCIQFSKGSTSRMPEAQVACRNSGCST